MTTGFRRALDSITRVRGVHGAMLVAGDDGLVIAEALMEGVNGKAVAALASSLSKRMRHSMDACKLGRRTSCTSKRRTGPWSWCRHRTGCWS